MHLMLTPLLSAYPDATWMTIGDGRYGSDAYFIKQQGVSVVASSISDATLKIAVERGYIESGRKENAEALTAADESFDFVYCKEAYHHFSRPPIGFYEMLRVAKIGVVMVEPIDQDRLLNRLKNWVKVILRKDESTLFEPVGNFLYRVSVQEIWKMVMALDCGLLAVRKFNDFYHPRLARGTAERSSAALFTHLGIGIQDLLCRLGLLQWGLATVVVFKRPPDDRIVNRLSHAGFRCLDLPPNPYQ
jgi:SAM-dependent methyltransferase